MADKPSLDALFNKDIKTREKFISEYMRLKETAKNDEDTPTIFQADMENAIGALYDTVDFNKDGIIDEGEIQKVKDFDTTDGENTLSESDISILYDKTIEELSKGLKLDTPENMYKSAMSDDSSNSTLVGEQKGSAYLSNLSSRIDILNELIQARQSQSNSKIMTLRNELDKLISEKSNLSRKEKDNYSKNLQKIKAKEKELTKAQRAYAQKEEKMSVVANEIQYLSGMKTKDKNTKEKLDEWLAKYNQLKDDYDRLGLTIESLKSSISDLESTQKSYTDKAGFENSELTTKKDELEKAIEGEHLACQSAIAEYSRQISGLSEARAYAVAQTAPTSVIENYSDSDTTKFEENAQNLKNNWGSINPKLSDGFYQKVIEVSNRIGCDANDLMALMKSESSLNSKAQNPHGGATGLIQFMPKTAQKLGTSTTALYNMSPEQQLVFVEKYFNMTKKMAGFAPGERINAGQLYTLTFLPAYAKREVLAVKGHKYYDYNSGLDVDKDGKITESDLAKRMERMKPKSKPNQHT